MGTGAQSGCREHAVSTAGADTARAQPGPECALDADPEGLSPGFLRRLEVRGVSKATRRSYASDLDQLLQWLAARDLTLADLDRRTVRAYAAELGRRGYAPATRRASSRRCAASAAT